MNNAPQYRAGLDTPTGGGPLSTKDYWSRSSYSHQSLATVRWIPRSLYESHLLQLIEPHLGPTQRFIELGVAPGLRAIAIASRTGAEPFGIDYSESGVLQTKGNFRGAGLDEGNVRCCDVMNAGEIAEHTAQYDLVYSGGLVEHFEDIRPILARHADLARPSGVVFVTVPNLAPFRRFLPASEQSIHNFGALHPASLAASMPPDLELLDAGYFGGLFDLGLFAPKHWLTNFIRLGIYACQRLTVDIIQRALLRTGVDLSNSRCSPGIYAIARKSARSLQSDPREVAPTASAE